jgi:sigma-E factor negative regulatory protein RseA
MDKMETHEMISALADGHLHGEAFARGIGVAAADAASLATWHAYHLIGEVLRTGECSAATQPSAFLGRLQAKLAQEAVPPVAVKPGAIQADAAVAAVTVVRADAANDGSFRWKLIAGFASAAAIAAVGWALVAAPGTPGQVQLATVPAGAVLANTERGAMIRDARLDEFLAAHRQLGGGSALPTPAGFLRNATFEAPVR